MSDIFDEYGLEPENPDVLPYDSVPKTKRNTNKKKGGGWLGRIVAFVLGIVIAFGSAFGGVYFALNRPTKDVLTILSPFLGKDYEQEIKDKLFSSKYENKTLLELPELFTNAISQETLGALADISPFIGEYLGEMITNINKNFGFSLDSNTIMDTKYTDLPTYLGDSLFTTPLGNILSAVNKGKPLEPMLMELCYGVEGEDYILDGKGQAKMLNGKTPLTISNLVENPTESIYKLRVSPILNPGTDPLFLPMCYGKEDVTFVTQKDTDGNILVDENGNAKVTMLPMFYEKVSVTEEEGIRDFFADYNGKEVMGTVNTKKSSIDYLYFEEKNEEGTIVDEYYLVQDPETERFYLFKPMNLSYTREGNVFTSPVSGNIIEEEDLYIHFNETDAQGNSLRQYYLVMHPDSDGLYEAFSSMDISYDKNENGEFLNENGEVVKGTILKSTQYYIHFAETDVNDKILRQYYLIHNTETGKYQAYDAMNMRYARTEDNSFIHVLRSEVLEETEKYLVIEEKDIAGNPLYYYLEEDLENANKYNAYNVADYNEEEVMGTINTEKSSIDYLYFEEKNEEGAIVDEYYLVPDPKTEKFYLFKPMNLSYTREGNVFTKPVSGNIIEEEDLYIHFNETDAQGNSLRQYYLVMHPDSDGLYEAFSSMDISYDKNENGEFLNENGEVVKGTILESTQYYIHFAETDENDKILRQYYLIHNTETGKYQAYDAMDMRYARTEDNSFIHVLRSEVLEETEKYLVIEEKDIAGNPLRSYYLVKDSKNTNKYNAYNHVYFEELTIGDLASGSDNLLNNIYLKDALKVYPTGNPETEPHKILYSLAYGVADKDYKIVGTGASGVLCEKPRTIGDLTQNSGDIINGISIGDLITPKTDSTIVMYLVYGKKGTHYDLVPKTDENGEDVLDENGEIVYGVVPLQRQIALIQDGENINLFNEYGEPLDMSKHSANLTQLTYTDNNGTVYTIKKSYPLLKIPVKDTSGKIIANKKADIYYLFEYGKMDEDGNPIPVEYKASTVGDLTGESNLLDNMLKRMTVYDIFGDSGVEGNKFLRHLGDCTINELPNAIEKLSVGEIFTADIFVADNEETLGYYLNKGEAFTDTNGVTVETGQFYIVIEDNGTEKKYFFDYHKAYGVLGYKQKLEETHGIQLYRMSDWGFYVYQEATPIQDANNEDITKGDLYIRSPQKDEEGNITHYLTYKLDPAVFATSASEKAYEKEYGVSLNNPGFYRCPENETFTDAENNTVQPDDYYIISAKATETEKRYKINVEEILGDLFYEVNLESALSVQLRPMSHGYFLNRGTEFLDHDGVSVYTGDFYLITDEQVYENDEENETTHILNKDEDGRVYYNIYWVDPLHVFDTSKHEAETELHYHTKLNVELNKQWKYLLKTELKDEDGNYIDEDGKRVETPVSVYKFDYSVATEMNALTDNMAKNVQSATMRGLHQDGLLTIDEDLLNNPVMTSLGEFGSLNLSFIDQYTNSENLTVGDLTISHMLEYNLAIVDMIANFDLNAYASAYVSNHMSEIVSDYMKGQGGAGGLFP